MFNERISSHLPQLPLFLLEEGVEQIELFPELWSAAEKLISQDLNLRWEGLETLLELHAPRYSPLVVYLLCTRIVEPDIDLRSRVIETLGDVTLPDMDGIPAPENVRIVLIDYVSRFRTRQIHALLRVMIVYPSLEGHVSRLINICSYASNHLGDIIVDRKAALDIRRAAIRVIGLVGFIDAIPALDRLSARLEARMNGQRAMSFAHHSENTESELIEPIREALVALRAP